MLRCALLCPVACTIPRLHILHVLTKGHVTTELCVSKKHIGVLPRHARSTPFAVASGSKRPEQALQLKATVKTLKTLQATSTVDGLILVLRSHCSPRSVLCCQSNQAPNRI